MKPANSPPEMITPILAAWPLDQIRVQVSVAHPRSLDPLEWAIIAAALAFGGDVDPTEAAAELGVGDAVLIDDAADELVALGALTRAEDGRLSLTPRGGIGFDQGQVELRPAVHGTALQLDGLLDVPWAVRAKSMPAGTPAVADSAAVGAPRSAVSEAELVALPAVAKLLEDSGRLVGAAVLDTHRAYAPVKISLRLGATVGIAEVAPDTPQGDRAAWLRTRGPDPAVLAPLAQRYAWAQGVPFDEAPTPTLAPEPPKPVETAIEWIKRAKATVVIHEAWVLAPGVVKALDQAVARGVTLITARAADAPFEAVVLVEEAQPAVWLQRPAHLQRAPAALVVDGARALVLERRTLRAEWDGSPIEMLRVAEQQGRAARQAQAAVLAALVRARPAPHEGTPTALVAAWAMAQVGETEGHTAVWQAHRPPLATWADLPEYLARRRFAPDEERAIPDGLWSRLAAEAPEAEHLAAIHAAAADLEGVERRQLGHALVRYADPDRDPAQFAALIPPLVALLGAEALAGRAARWCVAPPMTEGLGPWLAARGPVQQIDATLPLGAVTARIARAEPLPALTYAAHALGALDQRAAAAVNTALATALAVETLPAEVPAPAWPLISRPVVRATIVEWVWRIRPLPDPDAFIETLSVALDGVPEGVRAALAGHAVRARAEDLALLRRGGDHEWRALTAGWKTLGFDPKQLNEWIKRAKKSKGKGKRR